MTPLPAEVPEEHLGANEAGSQSARVTVPALPKCSVVPGTYWRGGVRASPPQRAARKGPSPFPGHRLFLHLSTSPSLAKPSSSQGLDPTLSLNACQFHPERERTKDIIMNMIRFAHAFSNAISKKKVIAKVSCEKSSRQDLTFKLNLKKNEVQKFIIVLFNWSLPHIHLVKDFPTAF